MENKNNLTGSKYGYLANYCNKYINLYDQVDEAMWYDIWFDIGFLESNDNTDGFLEKYVNGFNYEFISNKPIINQDEFNAGFILGFQHGNSGFYYSGHIVSELYLSGYENGHTMGMHFFKLSKKSDKAWGRNCNCNSDY